MREDVITLHHPEAAAPVVVPSTGMLVVMSSASVAVSALAEKLADCVSVRVCPVGEYWMIVPAGKVPAPAAFVGRVMTTSPSGAVAGLRGRSYQSTPSRSTCCSTALSR